LHYNFVTLTVMDASRKSVAAAELHGRVGTASLSLAGLGNRSNGRQTQATAVAIADK